MILRSSQSSSSSSPRDLVKNQTRRWHVNVVSCDFRSHLCRRLPSRRFILILVSSQLPEHGDFKRSSPRVLPHLWSPFSLCVTQGSVSCAFRKSRRSRTSKKTLTWIISCSWCHRRWLYTNIFCRPRSRGVLVLWCGTYTEVISFRI